MKTQTHSPKGDLKHFAYIGRNEDFAQKLDYLAQLAETEYWDLTDHSSSFKNVTLYHYLIHSFRYGYLQNNIVINKEASHAFFNTGLLSKNGHDILVHFIPSAFHHPEQDDRPYWFLKGFIESVHPDVIKNAPKSVKPNDYQFINDHIPMNASYEMIVNFDHIYEDHYERLPRSLKQLDKATSKLLFEGYLERAKERLKRNHRLSLLTLHHEKLNHLIPLKTLEQETMILALEEVNQTYIAKTILTPSMAYNNARILGEVNSIWVVEALRRG